MLKLGSKRRVTLFYGARDPQINHAIVLLEAAEKITRLSESEASDRG
jgi:hypothetical protein